MRVFTNLISPKIFDEESSALAAEIETNFDVLSPFLNWFTLEIFYRHGIATGLEFLDEHASKRLKIDMIFDEFGACERFQKIVKSNCFDETYVEVQSKSGFVEGLRRYAALRMIEEGCDSQSIAHSCGSSIRTIQRLKKQYQILDS